MLRTVIAFSFALAAAPAFATDIQKCVDPAGTVEYRNSACPSGTQAALLQTPAATGKTIEIRRSSDDRELRREKETQDILERPAPRRAEPVNALPPPPPEKEK